MALTGKTNVPPAPGRRKNGATLRAYPEAASQTYPVGAILIRSDGYVQAHTTSNVSVSILGFAAESGANKTAAGAANAKVWVLERDKDYKVVVTNAVAASQVGDQIALSQDTAGHVFGVTATASSDSFVGYITGFTEGFSAGDTNPVMYFVPLAAKIQEG